MLAAFVGCAAGFTACNSDDSSSSSSYTTQKVAQPSDDWIDGNTAFFIQKFNEASAAINDGSSEWKIFRSAYKPKEGVLPVDHNIVVQVLNQGTGTDNVLANDSVSVHYRGTYFNGVQFDSSWTGKYDLKRMTPSSFAVSQVIDGFSTALQNMHDGDRWLVFIPYNLGYGKTSTSSIMGCSTLIFDLTLVSHKHRGGTSSAGK